MLFWHDVPDNIASPTFEEAVKWFSLRAQIFFEEEYAPYVSLSSMAASSSVIGLWIAAAHTCRPAHIYETGTGASTIFFQNWVEVSRRPIEHYHAEDNKQWLKQLRGVAARHYDLPTVVPYDTFWSKIHPTATKLFLMDGFRDERIRHAEKVAAYQENSMIIFDDANRCNVQAQINGLFDNRKGRLIEPVGTDEHGRYATVWIGGMFPIVPDMLDVLYKLK
jgi:hypothetical protein